MHAAEIPTLQSYNSAMPRTITALISLRLYPIATSRMPSPAPTSPCTQSCASAARAFLAEERNTPSLAPLHWTTEMDNRCQTTKTTKWRSSV